MRLVDPDLQFVQAIGKGIARGRQFQLFRRQAADALAVHGELRRAGGGDHFRQPGPLDFRQHVGGDGLDLGHDEVRLFLLHQRAQGRAVGHVDDMGAVRHLMAGRIGVAIHRDDFHAQALQGDDHFLAQFAAAEQHDAGGGGAQWGADFHFLACFLIALSGSIGIKSHPVGW